MRNRFITTVPRAAERYRGITIHAHPGLHDELAQLFVQHVSTGATVLDVGAGEGAFSLRLKDLGYQVTALDIDPHKWTITGIPFRVLDLNRGLASSIDECYDAVCCIEVVEHVENPWALFRELLAVLKPGGIAVVSTPNVANFLSRLHFLLTGEFYSFGQKSLDMGHINPIHPYEVREIIRSMNWRIVVQKHVGYLPIMDFAIRRTLTRFPYKLIVNFSRTISYILSGGEERNGWCLAFVLEKPSAQSASEGASNYRHPDAH